MILIGVITGVLVGAILLFAAHLAPMFGAGNFVRDLDEPVLFGRALSRREAHLLGVLVHLSMSALFGGAYVFLVDLGILSGYDLLSIIGWGVIMSFVLGGIVFPLEGHGLFGVKEDAWFPVDLILTNIAWSILFWWTIRLWVNTFSL